MRISNKLVTFVAGLSASFIMLGSGLSAAAGNATLSLSPSSASETQGATFSLGVYENGNGSPVNVVTANMNYNSALLQFVGVSCGGAFGNTVTASGGNGGVSLSCYTAPGSAAPTGSAQVGTVSFKALASGPAVIAFASSSIVASNGANIWNGNTTGGTYTVVAPAATPTTPAPSKPKAPSTPAHSTGSTSSSSNHANTPSAPKTPSKPSSAKQSDNHRNNSRDIHGRLVSDNAGLNAGAYWAIGITVAALIAVALVFRKKLLDTAKVVATKYKLGRRV